MAAIGSIGLPESAHWLVTVQLTIEITAPLIDVSTAPADLTLGVFTCTASTGHNQSFTILNAGTFYQTYSFLYEGGGTVSFDLEVLAGNHDGGAWSTTGTYTACKIC